MKHIIYSLTRLVLLTATVIITNSCSDIVEVGAPKTELVRNEIFRNDKTADAAMTGVYEYAVSSNDYFTSGWYLSDVAYICGKSADELQSDAGAGLQLFDNELTPDNDRVMRLWRGAYTSLYRVNAILEGLESATGVSPAVREQLQGEAQFMRAFNYFYLVNSFGDVPLLTKTDYRVNAVAPRTPVDEVYDLIISDLVAAREKLPDNYALWEGERVRPVKAAATALLARVSLYREDWEAAEQEASEVIDNTLFSMQENLDDVFLKNNTEAIWQFYPPQSNLSSKHGYTASAVPSRVKLTTEFLNAFEVGDNRSTTWIGSRSNYKFAFKYKVGVTDTWSEYTTNLRLAEQYLIRAEARTQQDNIEGAQADINIIRNRAGLGDTDADTAEELLLTIKHERRMELFGEYGHRWFDLKRWGDVDAVLTPLKPNWQPTDALYPLPADELNRNKNLTQNDGYSAD